MKTGLSRVYKYLDPDGIQILSNRSIRVTQPSRLNDPFEGYPTIDAHLGPLLTAVSREIIEQLFASKNLPGPRPKMAELLQEFDHLIRTGAKAKRHEAKGRSVNLKDRHGLLLEIQDLLDTRFGVLCLTEKADDLAMWSHYGKTHRGFVLEFDAEDPFFDRRTFPGDPLRCLRKIQYRAKRPVRAAFSTKYWLRSLSNATEDLLTYVAGLLLLTKSSDWAYEKEWRMILPLSQAEETEKFFLVKLPPSCIRSVILGSNSSDALHQQIHEILEQPEYTHVDLRWAHRSTVSIQVIIRDDGSVLENRLLENIGAFPHDGIRERVERLGVSGPRFYAAVNSLCDQGLISAPPLDRSKREKRRLVLTAAGKSRLSARLGAREEAARVLKESLKSSQERLLGSLFAGGRIPSPRQVHSVVDELMKQMVGTVVEEALAVALSGEELRDPQIEDSFAALGDEDELLGWGAAESLQSIGDAQIVEHLLSILLSRGYEELIWLQHESGELDEDEVDAIESEAPIAYWMIRNRQSWGSDELRRRAACALAGIAARVAAVEAVDPLIKVLRDPDEDVRWQAAEALGHFGSARALPHLERLIKRDVAESSWGRIADAARRAIRKIRREQKNRPSWEWPE